MQPELFRGVQRGALTMKTLGWLMIAGGILFAIGEGADAPKAVAPFGVALGVLGVFAGAIWLAVAELFLTLRAMALMLKVLTERSMQPPATTVGRCV